MFFSVIIPVYNRPDEIDELLQSLESSDYAEPYEIVIVEDGSTIPCDHIISKYRQELDITYLSKPNSGPGDSRNFGMRRAKGDYFIIFDSDCVIPTEYLSIVSHYLEEEYVDCYGGPDSSTDSFSDIQKAVDFAMTSIITTGGIRGASERLNKFQPRSFNMGISRTAFNATNGFGNIHPGEDPDLSIRLWKLGFKTKLFSKAFVYHKRRISWLKFYQQVSKFGKVRPILNSWHPNYTKLTFFFPSLFLIGFAIAALLLLSKIFWPMVLFGLYFLIVIASSAIQYKSFKIGVLSAAAVAVQFYGYGSGFLKSFMLVQVLNRKPEDEFPNLFFKNS